MTYTCFDIFLRFLFFFGGIFAVFRLSERRFLDWRLGLLASLFLVLSPRFFAESFYNNKDIVFMALFAIAMNANIAFVLRPGIRTALFGALAAAIAIDVRIMGVVLPVVTLFLLLIRLTRSDFSLRTLLPKISLYFSSVSCVSNSTLALVVVCSINEFFTSFSKYGKFSLAGECPLYG